MGLFSLYKPKEYKHRYIYYDPEKEAQKEREKNRKPGDPLEKAAEYKPTIKRGTFREMADKNKTTRIEESRKSNSRLVMIIILLVAIAYFLLK